MKRRLRHATTRHTIRKVERLSLSPDDVILLTVEGELSAEQEDHLRSAFLRRTGISNCVVVLANIGVMVVDLPQLKEITKETA